jgi:hypothetical protein
MSHRTQSPEQKEGEEPADNAAEMTPTSLCRIAASGPRPSSTNGECERGKSAMTMM